MSDIVNHENMVVGVKQTMRMLEHGKVKRVYIAEDADFFVVRPILEVASATKIKITSVESKKKLGRLCGIDIGTATAAILI